MKVSTLFIVVGIVALFYVVATIGGVPSYAQMYQAHVHLVRSLPSSGG